MLDLQFQNLAGATQVIRETWTTQGTVEWTSEPGVSAADVQLVVDGTGDSSVCLFQTVLPSGTHPIPSADWMLGIPSALGMSGADVDLGLVVPNGIAGPIALGIVVSDGVIRGVSAAIPERKEGRPHFVAEVRFRHLLLFLSGGLWFRELMGLALSGSGDLVSTAAFSGVLESPEGIELRDSRWITRGLWRLAVLAETEQYQRWRTERG